MIFHDKPRTRRHSMRDTDSVFAFLDNIDNPTFATLRQLVNEWTSELSSNARLDMSGAMRSGENGQFHAAMCELMVHAMVTRLGYRAVTHPEISGTPNRPDFLVLRHDKPEFYVEVTSVTTSPADLGRDRRRAQVVQSVDQAKIPSGRCLHLTFKTTGVITPPLARLRAEVEAWARSIPADELADEPSKLLAVYGWTIEVRLRSRGEGDHRAGAVSNDGI